MGSLGQQIRFWRNQKGYSQLALSEMLGTSTRHLSFIETGRGHPSRGLLMRMARELDVPMGARNHLLDAAGYAPQFGDSGLSAPEMAQMRTMLDFILRAALPYPAMVLDRYWNVVMSNSGLTRVIETFATKPDKFLDAPLNLMQVTLSDEGLRPHIQNGDAFLPYMIGRLRRSFEREANDAPFEALRSEFARYEKTLGATVTEAATAPQLLMPIHLRRDDAEVRLCTTMATIGMPQDATLQELFVECAFPMDDATDRAFQTEGDLN